MAFKVLVFDGCGICRDSITGLVHDLRSFLTPNYLIGHVDQTQLRSGKWAHTCALLALPHCSHPEVYNSLGQDSEAIEQIRNFVRNGGSFLGIGGGAFFASARAEWAGRMTGAMPLALFPGTSSGPCLRVGTHLHDFNVNIDGSDHHCYLVWEDGGEFKSGTWTSVLARYNGNRSVAAISVSGEGNVVLWHARLEYALTAEVVRGNIGAMPHSTDEDIEHVEQCRRIMFKRTLQALRLEFPNRNSPLPPKLPFPQLLVAQPDPTRPENAFVNLRDLNPRQKATFKILPPAVYGTRQDWTKLRNQSQSAPQPFIWVVSPHQLPPADATPHFDISRYFSELVKARGAERVSRELGRYLLYGEAVTSTHSQLSENPGVANKLPSPLLSLATFQLQGICSSVDRAWLSPYGVLQWTLMLDVPNRFSDSVHLDAAVHIVSLAVVEACRPLLDHAHTESLGLKWPNDIFITSDGKLEKVGGVLVELIPPEKSATIPEEPRPRRILIGCGLDVCNSGPLPALQRLAGSRKLLMEEVAARVMAQLSIVWERFSNDFSFVPFMARYSNALLHIGRNVRLRTQHEETSCTIKGVDDRGRLQIALTDPQPGEADCFLAACDYSFDIHRNILYPRSHA